MNSDRPRFLRLRLWHGILVDTRSRILIWYVLLMIVFITISTLAIRQTLLTRLEVRIKKSLAQEVEEFRLLTQEVSHTQGPLSEEVLEEIFEDFLDQNIPDDDEFLITLLQGQLYKSSPRALPPGLAPDSRLMGIWTQISEARENTVEVAGVTVLYQAQPVPTADNSQAVFVVAHVLLGELEEIDQAMTVVVQVSVTVLVVASVLAWLSAGRVLTPLRLLTETARSITESDLTRRIPVRGSDDLAELATTFNQMLDRLQTAFASQRNFINDAGHELRTPITIIRGHLELMGDDPEDRQETLTLVTDELDRMNRFVTDLLLLAKAEQPDFLTLESVELNSLTEELYNKAKALAVRQWRLDARGTGQIVVDRQRLTQAIINLAENATQHTQPEDVIAIGSALSEGQVRMWVRDTGAGIPLQDQERIFQRFARSINRQRRSEGAGLGLSIVLAIAQAHGGRVELQSQVNLGSNFTLVLPRKPPQEKSSYASDSHR